MPLTDFDYIEEYDPLEEAYAQHFEELQYLYETDTREYNRKVDALTMDILDPEKYIKENELQKNQITNPIFFTRNKVPTPDGLLSNEIFGLTRVDRIGTFAWIDLNGTYLDPSCCKQLYRLDKRFKNIVHHLENYRIGPNGELIEDPEKGETGIEFIKKNINKIKFKNSKSIQRQLRIKYIEKNKSKMFINKLIVIPAGYRDVEITSGKTDVGAINKLYSAVISNVKALESSNDMGFFDNTGAIKGTIQEKINQIYDWFAGNPTADVEKGIGISGKFGLMRRANQSKTTDFSSRLVLSLPNLKVEYVNNMNVTSDTVGLPLSVVITNYKPFMLFTIKNFFSNEFNIMTKYPVLDKKDKLIQCTPKNIESEFSDERIETEMHRFLHGYQNRLIPIEFHVEEFEDPVYMVFKGRTNNLQGAEDSLARRKLTWCDVFYMAAVEVTKDKLVLITRYPIESAYNQVPVKIFVLSTNKTEPMYVDNTYYKAYPSIRSEDIGIDTSSIFEDTLQISTSLLKGINGDQRSPYHSLSLWKHSDDNRSNCWKTVMTFQATA